MRNAPDQKARRKELRNCGTAAEAMLWSLLRRGRICGRKFRRQYGIGRYIVDFYCPECRLIVELDGAPHYWVGVDEYQAEREGFLTGMGMKMIRFENKIVFENPEGVVEAIKQAVMTEMGMVGEEGD